jgi:two-component system, chemotaxis family, CheB/CheR fusion protein
MKTPEAGKPRVIVNAVEEMRDSLQDSHAERANQRLRMIINRTKKVLDNIPHIAFVANTFGENIYLNKKWFEYTGIHPSEAMGLDWKRIVHPEDLPPDELWKDTKRAEPVEFEYRLKNSAGEYIWHLCRALPVDEGNVSVWIGTATDINEKKHIEQQLLEEKFFIEKVAEATPDLIAVYDIKEKEYKYITPQIHDLTGVPAGEFITMEDFKAFIHPEDWHKFIRFHKRFEHARDKEVKEIEFRSRTVKGGWRWFMKKGKAFKRSADGRVTHVVTITQDITDRKEAEAERKENQVMHELLLRKDEFLSEASHELKTPVTTIKSSLQIIKRLFEKDGDRGALSVFLVKANQQVNKLTDLISNLMDNSRIQTGQFTLHLRSTTIEEVINDALIHNPGKHRIIIENAVERPLIADKHRLEQVLINFITNAVKYSPSADKLIIRATEEGENLKVAVQDFGIGIATEQQAKIFGRFFRVDHASVQFSGLGLGLYISAEIIRLHHGRIGLESEADIGSTFWFSIPFSQPEN